MEIDGIVRHAGERTQTAFLFGLSARSAAERDVGRFEVSAELTPQPGLPVVVEQNRLGGRVDDQAAGSHVVRTTERLRESPPCRSKSSANDAEKEFCGPRSTSFRAVSSSIIQRSSELSSVDSVSSDAESSEPSVDSASLPPAPSRPSARMRDSASSMLDSLVHSA